MSKSSITRSITVLFVLIASIALVTADLILVSAQNTNSSTTQSDEQTRGGTMTSQNTNTSSTGGQRRGRRRRRSTRRNTNMSGDMAGNANMGDMAGNANTADDTQNANMTGDTSGNTNMSGDMSGATGGRRRRRGRRRAVRLEETSGYMQNQELERTSGRQEDLTGQSYTGTVNYSEGSLSGPATLSFESGNQFTLTPEGGTAMSGRYSAVTTRGYTGVTMMFTGATPPTIVSVRLRKVGNGVSIMSVPGENRQFSFTSSGGGGGGSYTGGRRRRRRVRRGMRYQRPRGAATTGIKPPMGQPGGEPDPEPTPTP